MTRVAAKARMYQNTIQAIVDGLSLRAAHIWTDIQRLLKSYVPANFRSKHPVHIKSFQMNSQNPGRLVYTESLLGRDF